MNMKRLPNSCLVIWLVGFGLSTSTAIGDEPPTLEGPGAPASASGSDEASGSNATVPSGNPTAPATESTAPTQEVPSARAADPSEADAGRVDGSQTARDETAEASPIRHEVFLSPSERKPSLRVDRAPPEPINERPGDRSTATGAQWLEGYWDWEPIGKEFVWVTGTWKVPPPGSFWVSGYWRRDDKGWFRVPGFWSRRHTAHSDWRRAGPPVDRPAESVPPAPGSDYFYVPGEYVPDGEGLVWKAGFWSKAQPGWEWVPANWIHLGTGWSFRQGFWKPFENVPSAGATSVAGGEAGQPYTSAMPANYGGLTTQPTTNPPQTLESQVAAGVGPYGLYYRGYNAPMNAPGQFGVSPAPVQVGASSMPGQVGLSSAPGQVGASSAPVDGRTASGGVAANGDPTPVGSSRLDPSGAYYPSPLYYTARPGYYLVPPWPGAGSVSGLVNSILNRFMP